jgi:hypothetical protein
MSHDYQHRKGAFKNHFQVQDKIKLVSRASIHSRALRDSNPSQFAEVVASENPSFVIILHTKRVVTSALVTCPKRGARFFNLPKSGCELRKGYS